MTGMQWFGILLIGAMFASIVSAPAASHPSSVFAGAKAELQAILADLSFVYSFVWDNALRLAIATAKFLAVGAILLGAVGILASFNPDPSGSYAGLEILAFASLVSFAWAPIAVAVTRSILTEREIEVNSYLSRLFLPSTAKFSVYQLLLLPPPLVIATALPSPQELIMAVRDYGLSSLGWVMVGVSVVLCFFTLFFVFPASATGRSPAHAVRALWGSYWRTLTRCIAVLFPLLLTREVVIVLTEAPSLVRIVSMIVLSLLGGYLLMATLALSYRRVESNGGEIGG